jgi:hypothetical protein
MDFSQHVHHEGQISGSGIVNGHDCYKVLLVQEKAKPSVVIWVDKKSYAVVKIEDLRTKSSMVAFDYRTVAGDIVLPFKNNQYMDGRLVSVTTLSSIEVNKGLPDGIFDPDKVSITGGSLNLGVKSNMKKGILKRFGNERSDRDQRKEREMQNTGVLRSPNN